MAAAFTTTSTTKTEKTTKTAPWEMPWWRPSSARDLSILLWVCLIHITAAIGLVLYPIPGWRVLLGAIALVFIGGLGTTVGYHRAITHRALTLNPWARGVLIFFAMFNGSGAPTTWAAGHRLHHAKADTPDDISSPIWGGFWWAHLRWLWQAGEMPVDRYCPDLSGVSYRAWRWFQTPILALSYLGGLYFSPAAFFWLGAIRLCFATARAMFRQQRLPHRTGHHGGPGFQPQRKMACADASVSGRELASQPSRAPRFCPSGMELAPARRRLRAHPGAREARPRHQRSPWHAQAQRRQGRRGRSAGQGRYP